MVGWGVGKLKSDRVGGVLGGCMLRYALGHELTRAVICSG